MSDPNVTAIDSSAAAPIPAAPAPAAIPQGTSPVAATPATPPAPAIGAPEDRSNWVPPHRIRETTQKYEAAQRQWAERDAQYQAQIQQHQRQLQALTGVLPPPDPEVSEIRQRFGQVFPGLSRMEERAEQLEQYMEKVADLEAAVDHIWRNHSQQSMNRVYDHAEKTLGSPLNDEGKQALRAAFAGYVQSNPEYQQRYVDDPTIVDQFWKTLSSTLVDPARRASAISTAARVPGALPQDSPAGLPPTSGPAPQPQGLDARAKLAYQMFQAERAKQ